MKGKKVQPKQEDLVDMENKAIERKRYGLLKYKITNEFIYLFWVRDAIPENYSELLELFSFNIFSRIKMRDLGLEPDTKLEDLIEVIRKNITLLLLLQRVQTHELSVTSSLSTEQVKYLFLETEDRQNIDGLDILPIVILLTAYTGLKPEDILYPELQNKFAEKLFDDKSVADLPAS